MVDVARVLARHCVLARTMLLPGQGTRVGDLLVVDIAPMPIARFIDSLPLPTE